jgi:hypothetical protein
LVAATVPPRRDTFRGPTISAKLVVLRRRETSTPPYHLVRVIVRVIRDFSSLRVSCVGVINERHKNGRNAH